MQFTKCLLKLLSKSNTVSLKADSEYLYFHMGQKACKSYKKQVVKLFWQKGHIATARGCFNCICQFAPMCTLSNTYFLQPNRVPISNGISIRSAVFCTAHGRRFLNFTMSRIFPT